MDRSSESFLDALRPDVVIPGLERPGGLNTASILATRDWFNARRRALSSTGGRPTNPKWTIKRQVPFAPETWIVLKALAAEWSDDGPTVAPGQVAGFLLEDAANLIVRRQVADGEGVTEAGSLSDIDDPRFTEWEMPHPFAQKCSA
jgi:hypothetical protein